MVKSQKFADYIQFYVLLAEPVKLIRRGRLHPKMDVIQLFYKILLLNYTPCKVALYHAAIVYIYLQQFNVR